MYEVRVIYRILRLMSLKDWLIFWGSLDHILLPYSISDPSLYGLLVTWALLSVVYKFPFCMLSDWCISRWTCYVTSWIYLFLFLKCIENLMDWHGMPGIIWHKRLVVVPSITLWLYSTRRSSSRVLLRTAVSMYQLCDIQLQTYFLFELQSPQHEWQDGVASFGSMLAVWVVR